MSLIQPRTRFASEAANKPFPFARGDPSAIQERFFPAFGVALQPAVHDLAADAHRFRHFRLGLAQLGSSRESRPSCGPPLARSLRRDTKVVPNGIDACDDRGIHRQNLSETPRRLRADLGCGINPKLPAKARFR